MNNRGLTHPPLPKVSIIVPVCNGERTLPRLLDSLRRLHYPPERLEILLVDNMSTDQSAELIRQSGFTYVPEDQIQSSYAARNRGIARAQGEVLAFTDADCWVEPDWIQEGLKLLGEAPADLVAGKVSIQVSDPHSLCQRYSAFADLHQEKFVQDGYAATANLLVRRPVIEALGGFHPRLISGGDRLFTAQAVARGYRLVFGEKAVVFHEAQATPRSLRGKAWRYAWGMVQLNALGLSLTVPYREWRSYLPGLRLYRDFARSANLSRSERMKAFLLIWSCKLAAAQGSWAASRQGPGELKP